MFKGVKFIGKVVLGGAELVVGSVVAAAIVNTVLLTAAEEKGVKVDMTVRNKEGELVFDLQQDMEKQRAKAAEKRAVKSKAVLNKALSGMLNTSLTNK